MGPHFSATSKLVLVFFLGCLVCYEENGQERECRPVQQGVAGGVARPPSRRNTASGTPPWGGGSFSCFPSQPVTLASDLPSVSLTEKQPTLGLHFGNIKVAINGEGAENILT